jgi:hypothetical protein
MRCYAGDDYQRARKPVENKHFAKLSDSRSRARENLRNIVIYQQF